MRDQRNIKQILIAPRGAHSAKPPEARERIEKLMGNRPRIELFAREITPGWHSWGDELEGEGLRHESGFVIHNRFTRG